MTDIAKPHLGQGQKNQRLVVRISNRSLSFSTVAAEGISYEPYALNASISLAANLREALRTTAMSRQRADRTLIMVDSYVLMIPISEFSEETCEQLYRHAFSQQEKRVVLYAVLVDLNCVAVFSIEKDVHTVCNDAFANAQYMPCMAPVWRHLHQRSYTGGRQKLYGYFHEHRMEVFAFGQNRFKFCNTFSVNNTNDALYYLLAVWKQLAMTPESDEMHLVGDIPDRDTLMVEAQKFVKRVFYIKPAGEFNRAAVTQIDDMPYDLMVLFVKGV